MKLGLLDKMFERWEQMDRIELQNVMRKLVRQRDVFAQVFEAMKEGILIFDDEGVVSFANRAAGVYFGVDEKEMVGQTLAKNMLGGIWMEGMEQGYVSQEIEISYPESRLLNFYLIPLKPSESDEGGESEDGYVLIVRDMTQEQRQTEEQLESEKLNALTLLAAGVAHEIGNPLNSLSLNLQLLERKLKKLPQDVAESSQDLLRAALGEVTRLDIILKQFLQAVRPTRPELSICNLNEVIEDTAELLSLELSQRKIALYYDLAEFLPQVEVDETQIKQVFYNLIRNAYQSITSSEGSVSLRTYSTDTDVCAVVSDTGTGISPEMMGTLFEPYRTTKSDGNGLGLLIVRRILREHGGSLKVESLLGKGTQMTVILPRKERAIRLLTQRNLH